MSRRAYVFRDRRVVFFWSPKCANTSLAQWLAAGLFPEAFAGEQPESARNFLTERRLQHAFRRARAFATKEGFHGIALVRDPYARAVSVFMEKFLYSQGRRGRLERLEGFAQKTLLRIDPGAAEGPFRGVSFVRFLEFVRDQVMARGDHREPLLNVHWNTQVPFLFRETDFRYDQLVRLESLAADLAPVAARLGIGEPFPRSRSYAHKPSPERRDVSDIPSAQLIAERYVPSPADLLSARARALIEEAYEIDFERLGYPLRTSAS